MILEPISRDPIELRQLRIACGLRSITMGANS